MKYKTEVDFLRIFACLLVIVSHLVCLVVYDTSYQSWEIANVMYVLRDACVPLFLVITGILTLNKKKENRYYIYISLKYILIYVFFAVLYSAVGIFQSGTWDLNTDLAIQVVINALNNPQGHLWYLPLVAQIYICIPILNKIATDKKTIRIFLYIWIFISIIKPGIIELLQIIRVINHGSNLVNIIETLLNLVPFSEFYSYGGYVLWGYYLYNYEERRHSLGRLIIVYMSSIFLGACLNDILLESMGITMNYVWSYFSIQAWVECTCITLIAKDYTSNINLDDRARRRIKNVSSYTFGIYLIHAFFTEKSFNIWVNKNIIIYIPLLAISIFAICAFITYVYKKTMETVGGIIRELYNGNWI